MYKKDSETLLNTVYIVFQEPIGIYPAKFLYKFLKKGFTHCYIMIETKDAWLKIEPMYGYVDISSLDFAGKTNIRTILPDRATHKIVKVKFDPWLEKEKKLQFGLKTCVTLAKAFIGLKSWTITPYGLYKSLLKKKYRNIYSAKEV